MKVTCKSCSRPAVSATLGLCEVCAYAAEVGHTKAAEQAALAEADKAKRKRPRSPRGRARPQGEVVTPPLSFVCLVVWLAAILLALDFVVTL